MTALLLPLIALLALGALVSLDERVFGPFRLQQPLVAATAAGALVGDVRAGLLAGVVMTALWPALVPSGGNLLPSIGLGAVAAGAITAAGERLFPGTPGFLGGGRTLALGVSVAWLVAIAGRESESWLRRRNERREARAFGALVGWDRALDRALWLAARDAFLRGWLLVGLGVTLAGGVFRAWLESGSSGASRWDLLGHGLVLAACGAALVDWTPRVGRVLMRAFGRGSESGAPLGPRPLVDGSRDSSRDGAPEMRLLTLDALYNPRGQQRGGVYRALAPLLPLPAREELHQFLASRSFQTHPALSGYVLGPVVAGGATRTGDSLETAQALHAPLVSGVGDRLFAGACHPALAWLGLSVGFAALSAFLSVRGTSDAWWFAAPALVCVAGAGTAGRYWRGRSWRVGQGGAGNVAAELRTRPWMPWMRAADLVAVSAGAVAYGFVAWNLSRSGGPLEIAFLALGGATGALAVRTGMGPLAQAGLVVGAAFVATTLVVVGAVGGGGGAWSSGR